MQVVLEFILLALLFAGAGFDIRRFLLPNWLTLGTAILFIPWAMIALTGLGQIGWHLLTGGLALALGWVLFSFRIFGGGDAKWLAALALWLGPTQALFRFLVLVGFGGGLLALLVLAFVRLTGSSYGRVSGKQHLPYGVAIAAAGLDYWLGNLPSGIFIKSLF